jgi:hypothetical protein
MLSNFDDFKVCFSHTAIRAGPAGGNIGPARACGNAVFWAASGFVIHKATHDAKIGFHEDLLGFNERKRILKVLGRLPGIKPCVLAIKFIANVLIDAAR